MIDNKSKGIFSKIFNKISYLVMPPVDYFPNNNVADLSNIHSKGSRYLGIIPKRIKGIVIESHKNDSTVLGHSVELPILPIYRISLMQRNGEIAIPIVKVGDYVLKGQAIAIPTSNIALYRHAPTSGTVTEIADIRELHPSQKTVPAITISSDFLDEQYKGFTPYHDYQILDKKILLDRIYQSGISGMGGAGFPAEKKIDLDHEVDTLILNGAECEPYISCDDMLMRESSEDILRGAQVIARILSAKRILVGIESDKVEAISIMRETAVMLQDSRIEIIAIPSFYPMGSRQQIAHYLLGKETIVGKRSYNYGFICHNVATAKAYYDAICLGLPSIERLITVSGDAVLNPKVLKVRVGTMLSDIFIENKSKDNGEKTNDINNSESFVTLNNNDDNNEGKVIDIIVGGTMMGFNIDYENSKQFVIKKETTSILAFSKKTELLTKKQEKNCIRCSDCAKVCPVNLLPQQLYFFGKAEQYDKAESFRLFDCIECGCCAYVCPSEIPLVQYFQHSKGKIREERNKQNYAENSKKRFENRLSRIEAEKAEKLAKQEEKRRLLAEKKKTEVVTEIESDVEKPAAQQNEQENHSSISENKEDINKPSESEEININNSEGKETDLIAQALARSKARKLELEKQQKAKTQDN